MQYVQSEIHLGNSFLVNLTQPTLVHTNHTLVELYNAGFAKYKLWLAGKFAVFSPEAFVRIKGCTISSFPMKGTIDATWPDAENFILNDAKEMAEHATIVDLIRNDLSMVSSNVEVNRYRYVEKLHTNTHDLLQVSSEITGQLPHGFHSQLGDILFKLLPAGSICGAPKMNTLEIIENAEGYNRGFYTGVFGWFDGENLDSGVMIRFVEQMNDNLIFKSGGGITSQSDSKKEYEELIQKVYVPIP
jgi:para-aminobenzoate synthetase component 1